MSFVVSGVPSGFINYWHLRWEKVGNVVWEETQESATGLYSLTGIMWCEPNMKTNELRHVQRCFTLPALISICPSGQQAWIKHLKGSELGEKEDRRSPFLSRLADPPRQPFETYYDIRLTKKSRLTSCLILYFKTPLLELLRRDASLDAAYLSRVFFFFFSNFCSLIFP